MSDTSDPRDKIVKMRHPEVPGDPAETTQAAFDEVHSKNGWELVPEDEAPAEAPSEEEAPETAPEEE